jgi:succinate dehydrogenase/fumarate reductase flavoprotein subunit
MKKNDALEKETIQTASYDMGRRSFLKGAALSAVSIAGASALSACTSDESGASGARSGEYTFADTVKWDGEYDVIVVGFGGSGASAARTAAAEGAKVLLVEKAPEGNEGGNTMYAGQLFINGNGDVEATKKYYRALAGHLPLDEEIISVMAEHVADIENNYVETYGLNKDDFCSQKTTPDAEFLKTLDFPFVSPMCPEYPELEGSESISFSTLHDGMSDGYMWQTLRQGVVDHADSIDVWYESPGKKLIQDPISKTILGVQIERKGEQLNIRATNGVIMTCGGFENNPQMRRDFLGVQRLAPLGTLYNTGDGIKMVSEIGADLWHMSAWEGQMMCFGNAIMEYVEDDGSMTTRSRSVALHLVLAMFPSSAILVGTGGRRYINEMETGRHGHVYDKATDEWESLANPAPCFVIFDQTDASTLDEFGSAQGMSFEDSFDASILVKAASIEELAVALNISAENLRATVDRYNADASAEGDSAYGRPVATMRAFDGGPYYALKLMTPILNTQGGPRRSARAEVLDKEGNPIPHLYSAGEFGGITSNQYQGGGNLAECLIFGQIAGKNAAAIKDTPLPAYKAEPVESELIYVHGKESDL